MKNQRFEEKKAQVQENFKKVQIYIMCTQAIAMFCYIVYPNRQDLRPEVFPRQNILTDLMRFIYSFDNIFNR